MSYVKERKVEGYKMWLMENWGRPDISEIIFKLRRIFEE